jgi:two-component system sensor histidine kinase YesM
VLACLPLLAAAGRAYGAGPALLAACAGAAALAGALYFGYRWLYRPFRDTERMLKLFIEGYVQHDVYDLRYPYSPGMEGALKKLGGMFEAQKPATASRRRAQYLALQNQINPHFLYNTLEGIRGEAIAAGLGSLATMVETLALYFRYAISSTDQLVTLEDELENIRNYYLIQQYRFGEKIQLKILCDGNESGNGAGAAGENGAWNGSENGNGNGSANGNGNGAGAERLYKCRMPKVTLQPIVENAVIHGIERKLAPGHIQIKIESTEKRLIITVSDDGVGIDEERLREIARKLKEPSAKEDGAYADESSGIALVNVNSRIQLLFGEEYGLAIYSMPNVGTNVEITLPLITGRTAEERLQTAKNSNSC